MSKSEQRALADALAMANALCDLSPESSCAVANEHKAAVRSYIQSWVAPYIQMALESGVTGKSASLAQIYRRGQSGCKHVEASKILGDLERAAKKGT